MSPVWHMNCHNILRFIKVFPLFKKTFPKKSIKNSGTLLFVIYSALSTNVPFVSILIFVKLKKKSSCRVTNNGWTFRQLRIRNIRVILKSTMHSIRYHIIIWIDKSTSLLDTLYTNTPPLDLPVKYISL